MNVPLQKPFLSTTLRISTALMNHNNPKSSAPRTGINSLLNHGVAYYSLSTTTNTFNPCICYSTAVVPRSSNLYFLKRNFSSSTYPAPLKQKTFSVPFPLLVSVIGYLYYQTKEAFSYYPDSSKLSSSTRMKERLEKHGLIEKVVVPDGNCQMRALADQILSDETRHKEVRSQIIAWLEAHEKFVIDSSGGATLGDFIDRDQFPKWGSYIAYMSRNGAWGDHITLLAAAEVFGVTISVLSNVDDNGTGQYITNIHPKSKKPERTVQLSHWHEMHYNSLYPENPPVQVAA